MLNGPGLICVLLEPPRASSGGFVHQKHENSGKIKLSSFN
jgi:hypothetical protein